MVLKSNAMKSDPYLQSAAKNSPPLRQGARNSGVRILQECLIKSGYAMPISTKKGTQEPDGVYGKETLETVQDFQRDHGLSTDGIAGRDTLHRLDQLMLGQPHAPATVPLSPTLAGIDQAHWRLCAMWT